MELVQKRRLPKAAYSVNEFCDESNLGRSSVYLAMAQGRLKAAKFGRRTVILGSTGEEFLNSLPAAKFRGNGGSA